MRCLVDIKTIIYLDPPWKYNSRSMNRITKFGGGAMAHYPVMNYKELAAMKEQLQELGGTQCVMFMWTTGPWLMDSGKLLAEWGFKYSTVGFVWNKLNPKALTSVTCPGFFTSSSCEFVLIATKGSGHKPAYFPEPQFKGLPRREHSRKPDEFRQAIAAMYPCYRKIEMFARETSVGWEVHGNEVRKFDE